MSWQPCVGTKSSLRLLDQREPYQVSDKCWIQKFEGTTVFSDPNKDENCQDEDENISKAHARLGDKRLLSKDATKP